jgi:hypothetical protein
MSTRPRMTAPKPAPALIEIGGEMKSGSPALMSGLAGAA